MDELKEEKFDLAVIGYHHKRSLSDLLLGTTAQYLAELAPCRLLPRARGDQVSTLALKTLTSNSFPFSSIVAQRM